jgi:hypothetical protein
MPCVSKREKDANKFRACLISPAPQLEPHAAISITCQVLFPVRVMIRATGGHDVGNKVSERRLVHEDGRLRQRDVSKREENPAIAISPVSFTTRNEHQSPF